MSAYYLNCVNTHFYTLFLITVYCNAVPDNVNSLLYNGLIEELVDVLELQDQNLIVSIGFYIEGCK